MKNGRCPCCLFCTLTEQPPGTFEICPVCGWEDDNVQFYNPNFEGGANGPSLNQAQKNYKKYGAIEKNLLSKVRKPFPDEIV